jgi:hypothetical protein
MTFKIKLAAAVGAACMALLTACGSNSAVQSVSQVETVPKRGAPAGASSAERFGMPNQALPGMGVAQTPPTGFTFQTPPGWQPLPPTDQRDPNFVIGGTPGGPAVECYVTQLASDGGGMAANVNRWRSQMGLGPIEEAAAAGLSTIPMLGAQATLVELAGNFAGMQSVNASAAAMAAQKDKLLGAIALMNGRAVFVKMTGPIAAVDAQRDNFAVFCGSLRESAAAAQARGGLDVGAMPNDATHAGLIGGMGGMATDTPAAFKWTKPENWRDAGPAPMRDANFRAGAQGEVECYLAVAGGGLEANLNRWRSQMGQTPLSDLDIADLPTIQILGSNATMIAIEGTFQGMSGAPLADAMMLGAVRMLDGQSLFIKMTGPREAVEAERQAFIDFCQSIQSITEGAAQTR